MNQGKFTQPSENNPDYLLRAIVASALYMFLFVVIAAIKSCSTEPSTQDMADYGTGIIFIGLLLGSLTVFIGMMIYGWRKEKKKNKEENDKCKEDFA